MTDTQHVSNASNAIPDSPSEGRIRYYRAHGAHRSHSSLPSTRHIKNTEYDQSGQEPDLRALVFLTACSGVGLTTFAALCASCLQQRGHQCALMDLDIDAGGMDVLLGLEGDPGLRLDDIEAPLGRIDPAALDHEVLKWEGIDVVSCDPWKGDSLQWWDLEAALTALGKSNDVVLIDGARGQCLEHMEILKNQPCIVLVELSVLGLARTNFLISQYMQVSGIEFEGFRNPMSRSAAEKRIVQHMHFIAMEPRGLRGTAPVSLTEAENFLGCHITDCFVPQPKLEADLLRGLGIKNMPRAYRKSFTKLSKTLEQWSDLEHELRAGGIAGLRG